MRVLWGFVLILLISLSHCKGETLKPLSTDERRDTIYAQSLGIEKESFLILDKDINLNQKICVLPPGVTIKPKGGVIKNGIIVGDDTRIVGKGYVFENVRICGTWNVPTIRSTMFKTLDYDNSLKDVVALTSPYITNKVIVEKGNYYVTAKRNKDMCVNIRSKTEFILRGNILLTPNGYTDYDILHVEGDKIVIKGDGYIFGDKNKHLNKDGEWGMGIRVNNSSHVVISGITIKDCWGDCIYVGGSSTNVLIKNCFLDNGRRQGISITKAKNVIIKDCKIANISGTHPEYAIDVEPNPNDTVNNIRIHNIIVNHCKGGLLVWGKAPNAKVGSVEIANCSIADVKEFPILVIGCDNAKIKNNKISKYRKGPISYEDVGSIVNRNNIYR